MEKELRIDKTAVEIINKDQVRLQIRAVFIMREDGEEDIGFAIPNTIFEVRIGVKKVFEGQSDPETGIFLADFTIDRNNKEEIEIEITADDQADRLITTTKLKLAGKLLEYHEKIKKKIKLALNILNGRGGNIEQAWRMLIEEQAHPDTIQGVRDLANKKPKEVIAHVKYYSDAKWAEEIKKLAEERRQAAMDKKAEKVLEEARRLQAEDKKILEQEQAKLRAENEKRRAKIREERDARIRESNARMLREKQAEEQERARQREALLRETREREEARKRDELIRGEEQTRIKAQREKIEALKRFDRRNRPIRYFLKNLFGKYDD